ncbi:MAG: hypothetical protein ACLGHQ_05175, partial [Acidimicrobiia bacterium]
VFPELCHSACAATAMTVELLSGLEVDAAAMLRNVAESGHTNSEQLLSQLSASVGKHRAQGLLVEGYRQVADGAAPDLAVALTALVASETDVGAEAVRSVIERVSASGIDVGSSTSMVDRVVARARARRAEESRSW